MAAFFPLAAKWDKAGALKGEVVKLTSSMIEKMNDTKASDDTRFAAATGLLGLRSANSNAFLAVMDLLGTNTSPTLQRWIIAALGETDESEVGTKLATVFVNLPADVQPAAFDAVLKRADWTNAFLDAVKSKAIDGKLLGPAAISRLRTHPNKDVADARRRDARRAESDGEDAARR